MTTRPQTHLPLLRAGQPYTSLDQVAVSHIASGQLLARVSQANRGLIARDLNAMDANRAALDEVSVAELLPICTKAAALFATRAAEAASPDLARHLTIPASVARIAT